jgi:hypothetical protein
MKRKHTISKEIMYLGLNSSPKFEFIFENDFPVSYSESDALNKSMEEKNE